MAVKGIGIWHQSKLSLLRQSRNIKILRKADKKKFKINLGKIGYCFSYKKKSFYIKILKAFQRHFRKELINGVLDKECMIIAQNLSKKL